MQSSDIEKLKSIFINILDLKDNQEIEVLPNYLNKIGIL